MQEESHSKSGVIRKVENIVCDCVSKVFYDRKTIFPSEIYVGETNIPLTVRIARGAVFDVSHNRFGISYGEIARHANISKRNIIRSVKAYKDVSDADILVRAVNEFIDLGLKKFPL